MIARLSGQPSHEVVELALNALLRLSHRGGVDADGCSGDGAGLLTAIPQEFFRCLAAEAGVELPVVFGLGMVFLPAGEPVAAREAIESCARAYRLECLWWREVPIDASVPGPRARATLPRIEQCFFKSSTDDDLETALFRMRKHCESNAPQGTYFCSLSSRTVIYKGLLTSAQLPNFYQDLRDARFVSPFGVFHQRYSTNTHPSWPLAQPFRCLAHNGEINTVRGNRRWIRARQEQLRATVGVAADTALVEPAMSDSASLDNVAEVLIRTGYSAAAAVHTLIPPVAHAGTSPELQELLEGNAQWQEPWDGPAAIVFTDGRVVGAKLDRNGLRPLRYTVTTDGLLVVGSEAGIADFHSTQVAQRQRLGPGEMLVADLATGTVFGPNDTPDLTSPPLRRYLATQIAPTDDAGHMSGTIEAKRAMVACGWSEDRFRLLFQPMIQGQEAVWSMGDDAVPACLSDLRRPIWDFCKQRFAQVTNPPIDPHREAHVMSLATHIGSHVALSSPVLDGGQFDHIQKVLNCHYVDITFVASGGIEAALTALALVGKNAVAAGKLGAVILTDSGLSADRAPLPAMLAVSAAWRAFVAANQWDVPLIITTGQVIDAHHAALLIAAGATAVFPYLAFEQAAALDGNGVRNYRSAVEGGLRKTLARMGISTIASYRNSHLFETVGLAQDLVDEFFEDADCIPGGTSLSELLLNCVQQHAAAFGNVEPEFHDLGFYRFRHNGERHASSPEVVRRLHRYIKSPTEANFQAYAEIGETRKVNSLRDLVDFVPSDPIALSEVESEASLLGRFSSQAMSLGAISPEAHRTLAVAMNRLGARSNTGEGGEDPNVYRDSPEANNRVKQVASARFGVTTDYLVHADELEIKMAQGSKPGEGGQLPGRKVTAYIARLRHAVPNMTLISPPPHHDIYSIEDLAQLIYDLRAVNPRARIGVKLVSSAGVGIIAAGVAKAGADVITISGHDGGTGASPLNSITNTGLPWEIGLREAHKTLVRCGLRDRVRLRVDGGLKFARDVIVAALLGADEFGFGTAALLAIGCVMARQCHLNTCPVGIATQDEALRSRFAGNPRMVEDYFRAVAAAVRTFLARLGVASMDEIRGDVGRLRPRDARAAQLIGMLLDGTGEIEPQPAVPRPEPTGLQRTLHRTLADSDGPIARTHRFRITNSDRAVGCHISGEIARALHLQKPLLDYEFAGTAGQSFGAFLINGLTFRLRGEANDYVGKGLSGGTIAITYGPEASARGDVLAGNTVLYGATSGELYVAGRAGERFAVRNSGALAVVEGVGLHGCEYMTAGVVIVLGPAGENFGAGMTGGLAYVVGPSEQIRYNRQSVRVRPVEVEEQLWIHQVLRRHRRMTNSAVLSRQKLIYRVEPLDSPCSVTETWVPVLRRLNQIATVPANYPAEGSELRVQ